MNSSPTWHTTAIDHLARFFEGDPDARAVILSGSLATEDVQADVWSDVDVKIVLADHAVGRYYASTDWLASFGRLIGLERYDSPAVKTLRVCLEGFQRFDLVFIAESALQEGYRLQPPCKVLWTKLPDLDACVAPQATPSKPQAVTVADIASMADAFWFKASVAITKVARDDLLIAAHLALDLARDCLVLQMMRRDREKGTTVHRTGGWGNDLVAELPWNGQNPSASNILNLIQWSCETFDTLAIDLAPGYAPRAPNFEPALDHAKRVFCP